VWNPAMGKDRVLKEGGSEANERGVKRSKEGLGRGDLGKKVVMGRGAWGPPLFVLKFGITGRGGGGPAVRVFQRNFPKIAKKGLPKREFQKGLFPEQARAPRFARGLQFLLFEQLVQTKKKTAQFAYAPPVGCWDCSGVHQFHPRVIVGHGASRFFGFSRDYGFAVSLLKLRFLAG